MARFKVNKYALLLCLIFLIYLTTLVRNKSILESETDSDLNALDALWMLRDELQNIGFRNSSGQEMGGWPTISPTKQSGVTQIQLWEPKVIKGVAIGTFQGRIPYGEKRWGRYDWGHDYSPLRIFCLIPSLWPSKKMHWEVTLATWGKLCNKVKFVLCANEGAPENDDRLLIVPCDYIQSKEERNIWNKVMYMWTKVGNNFLFDFDWFLKIDDDTFFSPTNFRDFARYYDPLRPWYFGHTLLPRWLRDNIIFNSGTCYAISQATLSLVTPLLNVISSKPSSHFMHRFRCKGGQVIGRWCACVKRAGDEEDPTFSICLRQVGVVPTNSLSAGHKQRWLPFRDTDHITIKHERSWYWKNKPKNAPDKENCCVRDLVAIHNYKGYGAIQKFYDLIEKYNGTDNKYNEIDGKADTHPPKPSLFEYQIYFPIDEYLNAERPHGYQYIRQGPGLNYSCSSCDVSMMASIYSDLDKALTKYLMRRLIK